MKAKKRDPNRPPKTGWIHQEKPEPEIPKIPIKIRRRKDVLNQKLNSRKMYICIDCERRQLIHWTERARAKRIQCLVCGSYHLEPATAGALLELQREDENTHGINPSIKKTGA